MKRLIICEGPNELCIMRILLNNDKEYKRIKGAHKKGELHLADLLK